MTRRGPSASARLSRLLTRFALVVLAGITATGCISRADLPPLSFNTQNDLKADEEEPRRPEDRPFLTTSERYWVDTPWVTVNAVVIRVQRTQRETVIVLPEGSVMREYMAGEPNTVFDPRRVGRGDLVLFNFGFVTDEGSPFRRGAGVQESTRTYRED
jgi:hypothetical protein